jgi:ribonuclease HI
MAEYQGALEHGPEEIELRMDSQLVMKQLNGEYRVRDGPLQQRHLELNFLLGQVKKYSVVHVRRDQDARADELGL